MWRIPENENSDQSISEDDDMNGDFLEDHVSLGNPAEKKGEVQILSQLDLLRDANEGIYEGDRTSLFQKRHTDIYAEDDVELPIFANNEEFTYNPGKVIACNSDDEIIISDTEGCNYQKTRPSSFGGSTKDGVCTWLAVNADALINVNDNADCTLFRSVSAKAKRSDKGGPAKAKRKFSIRTKPPVDKLVNDMSCVNECDPSIKGKETDELENCLIPAEFPASHAHTTTSMAELLVRVQNEHDLPEGSTIKYNITEEAPEQLAVRRISSMYPSDIDDDPDCLASDSSEEDEYNHQVQELIIPDPKQKSIADQFQDALGAASTHAEGYMQALPKHTGFGLFGKLQHIMQSEKDRDSYFLNKLQKEDEGSYFDVKIRSKSLEAKLTVCSCSYIENCQSSTRMDNPLNMLKRKIFSIIFNPRICSDVEFDVGTLVRIHHPWKEVYVEGQEERIILSTYFSQI
uniref:uncharacterized protein LOC122607696 n=1 Tax=Erigeron canadensis TaxID=72917 RepID=UPI001CB8D743|nr:uncharacterized protein LOC122607696 [Erigeron canadensis]